MDINMESVDLGLQDSNKETVKYRDTKNTNLGTQEGAMTRSPRIRDSRMIKRSETISRTPSPATISRRKRGMRASLWSTTGSLPLAGALISTGSFDVVDAQEEQQPDSNVTSLVLDPVEHAWMIMVAEGNYDELQDYLKDDPSLLYQRDFVTGYSIIHWIAKHGHHEDLIRLMDFSRACGFPIDINARASGGLTPLHIAALQGHGMLIKVLVGAFNADIHTRDHSGCKAWQYLRPNTPSQLQELLGAPEEEEAGAIAALNKNNNCQPANSPGLLRGSDETDSTSKMTVAVTPLRNFFKNAYSFLKNW